MVVDPTLNSVLNSDKVSMRILEYCSIAMTACQARDKSYISAVVTRKLITKKWASSSSRFDPLTCRATYSNWISICQRKGVIGTCRDGSTPTPALIAFDQLKSQISI